MKKTLKILAYTVGTLALLLVLMLGYFHIKGIPKYKYHPPAEIVNLKVPRDSAHVARGKVIGTMHCVECHAGAEGKLTGKPMVDLPSMFGELHTLNITQDPKYGIGNWTDGELYYFIRTGIHKEGHWSPFMPQYSLLADEDVYSLIAWLRSDDPRLAPDIHELPPNRYNLLVKTLGNTLFGPPPLPAKPITIPDTTKHVAYGKYVADALSNCYICHSADILKVNSLVPEKSFGYYGGGMPLRNEAGETVPSANITMDKATGIGNWTEQEFIEAVRFGKNPRGGTLSRPMAPHSTLTDAEVKAIFTYLKTVPVIKNSVQRYRASVE
ncbi:c-type cytochrome [Haliscomenobacter hydrossis]|uniref:Cytochrome c n=1 Tax=Haliscomenobacter hydrossis (strain ATCC 27775 / DSM 1100 / LMG 10767 / O) TaxID=760192 RepID=F4L6W0_HALH1|nr:c-type cytochrome [Haliscomenobacter hydrossis]AEE51915.1 putative cytochrome c [Haliscomenobacter hydrossis DSM 1100]